jgi:hypothetical protein
MRANWQALAVLLLLVSFARATTIEPIERVCPVGGAKYKSFEIMSTSSFGMRLDLRRIGPAASLPRIECPNGFVVFKEEKEFTPDELAKLTPVVAADEYQRARRDEPISYRIVLLKRALGQGDAELRDVILAAAFDAEDARNDSQRQKYLALAEAAYTAFLAQQAAHDLDWWVASLRQAEIARQRGHFDDAQARATALLKLGPAPKDWILQVADQIGQKARAKVSEPAAFQAP